MRIFETHHQLQTALGLPALDQGAYRFCKQYGVAGFQCAKCGAVKCFPLSGCGTGYGVQHGQMFCYQCCIDDATASMENHQGPFYAYLASDKKTITAWPGGNLGDVRDYGESRTGWNGGTIARFRVRDTFGNWWSGRGPGAGMYCTLRRMKTPREYV